MPRPKRGGYPLAVMTVGVVCYLCALSMAFIPYFNPTGRTVGDVAAAAIVAVLNVTAIAALVLWLTDLGLRALRVSAVWAYAAAGGVLTFVTCFGLASALGGSMISPAFVAVMVLVPSAVGGWVLGLFRC
jgi:hypothetical protein